MAASRTVGLPLAEQAAAVQTLPAESNRRRRVDPASGRALEILGHAIEYLTDEMVHSNELIIANNPRLEAVQLLMGINRQIYLQCPEVETLAERCRSLLHLRSS